MSSTGIEERDFPLTRSAWKLTSERKFRRCSDTNKLIWPFQKAYVQWVAYGKSNSEPGEWDIQIEWLTESAYTYRLLKEKKYWAHL